MPVKKDVLDDDFQIFDYTSNDYEKIMGIIPVAKKPRVFKPLPPGKQARVVKPLPPGKQPRVFKPLPPGKQARVFKPLPPGKQARVVTHPGKQARVVTHPGKQPHVVTHPGKQPHVVTHPGKQPHVVTHPGKQARVVTHPGKQSRVVTKKQHRVIPEKGKKNIVVNNFLQKKNPILSEYSKKKGCEGSKLYNPSTKRCIDFKGTPGKSISMALNKIKHDLFKGEKNLTLEQKELLFQKFDDYKQKKKTKSVFGKKK